jgi:predicted transcriptional regulator
MATTINVSNELQKFLSSRKMYEKETYEEVIWDLVEDSLEINEETRKEIEIARQEAKAGKTYSFEEVMKQAGV